MHHSNENMSLSVTGS